MLKIGIIGAGKVGTALAVVLNRKEYTVAGVYDINPAPSKKLASSVKGCRIMDNSQQVADAVDLTFITTPDGAIEKAASHVKWSPGKSVVHCSGADSTDILDKARKDGASVGCCHPLQTFAGVEQAIENIPGSTFAIEAEEPLLTALKEMTADLEGGWITLKAADKAAYHAAAVIASNYLVTLVKMAADLWKTFSVSSDDATKALLPLMRGTLHNIETIGLPRCLTGPIARGDEETIQKHLDVIGARAPELLTPYKELGLQTIPIALTKGTIDEIQAKNLELILRN